MKPTNLTPAGSASLRTLTFICFKQSLKECHCEQGHPELVVTVFLTIQIQFSLFRSVTQSVSHSILVHHEVLVKPRKFIHLLSEGQLTYLLFKSQFAAK